MISITPCDAFLITHNNRCFSTRNIESPHSLCIYRVHHRVAIWTIIDTHPINHRNDTHRVAVGASGSSPETHALRTRNLSQKGRHIIIQNTHATQTRRTERGRASTRPYIACIGNHRVAAWAIITQQTVNRRNDTHRVAAWAIIAQQTVNHRNGTHRVAAWAIIAQQTVNHRNDTYRVAVGASGSSPEIHALPTRIAPRQRVPLVEGSVKWSGSRFTA